MPVLAISSLCIAVIGWFSYLPMTKIPAVRRTLWPTRAIFYLAIAIGCLAFLVPNEDPQLTVMMVSLACILSALFTLVFYTMLRLPAAAARPEIGKPMPQFEAVGEDGQPFSSSQFTGKGPLLFVFFRGFW